MQVRCQACAADNADVLLERGVCWRAGKALSEMLHDTCQDRETTSVFPSLCSEMASFRFVVAQIDDRRFSFF